MGFDDANHQEPADRAEYEAWEAKEALIRQRDEACAEVDKLKLQKEEMRGLLQRLHDAYTFTDVRLQGSPMENAFIEIHKYLERQVTEKRINEICWCASKAEAKDAVCPIHG